MSLKYPIKISRLYYNMSELQEKVSIFNPKDKLSENDKPKIYIEYIPVSMKSIAKKNNCKYDVDEHKWFTNDCKNQMIQDFSKSYINFWDFMKDMNIVYDKTDKRWYTYKSNEQLKKYFD